MAEIKVTASTLRQRAQELTQLNNNLNTQISRLESAESNVCSMWEGEAKNEFHKAFTHDKAAMLQFKQAIDKYVQALTEIAQKYETAEQRNRQTASNRTYH